jgi:hypothetical protein
MLKETANDSADCRAGIFSTVWVVVASQEQLLLIECRIRITSFGAEICEGVLAAFLETCRLAASEECTSNRCYEGLSDRRDSNQESPGKETTSTVHAERTWSLKVNSCS